MDLTQQIGAVIVSAAREQNIIDDRIVAVAELADAERELFSDMFKALQHYQRNREATLTTDEVSSMFTFVFAKSAEIVTDYVNDQKTEVDMAGLFDGKVPLYADERLVKAFKRDDWPTEAAVAFLQCDPENLDPVLALFEALKWCFRIGIHIAVTTLEDYGVKF